MTWLVYSWAQRSSTGTFFFFFFIGLPVNNRAIAFIEVNLYAFFCVAPLLS